MILRKENAYCVNTQYIMYAISAKRKTAKELLEDEKNQSRHVNLCGSKPKKSVVVMCDGTILSLPIEIDEIIERE